MERKVASLSGVHLDETAQSKTTAEIDKMSEIHRFSRTELDQIKILYQGTPHDKMLKVFRDLRTRVYAKAESGNFVCMVTSVKAEGGCSHVVKNLAAAIALDKTRTSMIVDANFYSPGMDSLVVTGTESGLTDYLDESELGLEKIIYATGIPRVRVVPVGGNTEGATERISSNRMRDFINELKTRYPDRYVLLDTPPALEYAAETRMLASLCDFVILVVPYGMATMEQVSTCVDTIGEQRLAAVVFNRTQELP
ncbi:Mrp family chromosome partitioning ATPase [Alteromonadaceae bacterium 2753L.S.0a.02]|nr:Mrp family chromosome partitioning ATPase [Alteromonadaceae bacterium 2753L.S.0a.02]